VPARFTVRITGALRIAVTAGRGRGAPILDGADPITLISQGEPVQRALRLPRVAPV
jgi:hypothetical protein